jgi:phosphoribosylformylglycinamidine synthase
MSTKTVKALIVSGDGVNCEYETERAFQLAGAQTRIVPISALLENPQTILEQDILAFPGGFSFGDELGAGRVLALKMKHKIQKELTEFVEQGKLVIGICNGFQILTQLGILPEKEGAKATLAANKQKHFQDRWVECLVNENNPSPWLEGLKNKKLSSLWLPIRHGEGRLIVEGNEQDFINSNYHAFTYTDDVNGSLYCIAGITNKKGNVLGLMPHPEAAVDPLQMPFQGIKNLGQELFESAVSYGQKG